MPRGSGGRSGGGMGGGFRPAARRPAPAPAPQRAAHPPTAPAHAPAAAAPQGPGLMGQMMATAGGVAIGSAVGHTIGNMMSGGGGHGQEAPVQQTADAQPYNQQQPLQKACEFEVEQFLKCTQTNDLSMCEGFNQVLKECRARYGY